MVRATLADTIHDGQLSNQSFDNCSVCVNRITDSLNRSAHSVIKASNIPLKLPI